MVRGNLPSEHGQNFRDHTLCVEREVDEVRIYTYLLVYLLAVNSLAGWLAGCLEWAQSRQIFVYHVIAPKRASTMKESCCRLYFLKKAAKISLITQILPPM